MGSDYYAVITIAFKEGITELEEIGAIVELQEHIAVMLVYDEEWSYEGLLHNYAFDGCVKEWTEHYDHLLESWYFGTELLRVYDSPYDSVHYKRVERQ